MKIRRNQKATIVHPNHADVKVTVRKLSKGEMMDYYGRLQESRIVTVLKHPATGQPFKEEGSKDWATTEEFKTDKSVVLGVLEKSIVGWEGIEDENGNPIPFDRNNIEVLLESDLDCTVEEEVEVEGEKTVSTVTKGFHQYITDQVSVGEVFNTDPLVPNLRSL